MIPEVAWRCSPARASARSTTSSSAASAPSRSSERMEFSEAKALITVDGARRKGKTAPIKAAGRRGACGDLVDTIFVVKRADNDAPMKDGRDHWYDEAARGRRRRVPGRADGRRGPAVHPLHVAARRPSPRASCTRPAATSPGRLHARSRLRPQAREDVYWCAADVGWVTGHSYIVYGPLANGATSVMYEGAPDYPRQGHLVGDRRALQGHDHLLRADRDPRVHEVGRRAPREARPVLAAAARHRRRADQPEGLALVLEGDRRRALPDRRHVVADRDRRDHDHDAAGRCWTPSRAPRASRCRASRRRSSTRRATTPAPSRAT